MLGDVIIEHYLYKIANYIFRGEDGVSDIVRRNDQAVWDRIDENNSKKND
ncbi:MAG: hypothetical protein WBA74_23900 [Cyclobacteriaceae bacterium]